jgi:hypothetical protein
LFNLVKRYIVITTQLTPDMSQTSLVFRFIITKISLVDKTFCPSINRLLLSSSSSIFPGEKCDSSLSEELEEELMSMLTKIGYQC